MKRSAALAALCVLLAARTPAPAGASATTGGRGNGEVRTVSVQPGSGTIAIVIDLHGPVDVQDFTLRAPARLVVDLVGAHLSGPSTPYDGQNRGGVKNLRYSQYRPNVVRVVVDLEALKDYHIQHTDNSVRIEFGADRVAASTWTSRADQARHSVSAPPPAPSPAPVSVAAVASRATADATLGAPIAAGELQGAPVGASVVDADGATIDRYLAAHAAESVQSQAPRITVRWDGADIEDVIAGFAAFSGRTIVLAHDVRGKVTAEIKNQPWDLAFAAVLESQGLTYQVLEGGIINVLNKSDFARADSTVPVETRLVRINYARATSLVPAVQSIISKGRGAVVADTTSNSLVVTDTRNRIADIEQFVHGLDIRTPQVSIQAKIIFVDRTDIEQLGLKYDLGSQTQFFNQLVQRPNPATAQPGNPNINGVPTGTVPTTFFEPSQTVIDLGGNSLSALGNASQQVVNPALNLIFSTAIGNFNLTTFLQALQSLSLDDIQAEPTITTLDNRPAEILVGDRVPIRVIDVSSTAAGGATPPKATVSFQQTGINLRVTPHVTANRQVLMEVHAERSNVVPASVDIGYTFQTQQADNQLLVADGETAVIGGLTVTEVTVSKTGIPFLVDLPILGKLFGFTNQQENRRDLLILITPHIIDDLVSPSTGK